MSLGYEDTPYLPGQPWRVHDINRPHPPILTPPTASTQDAPGAPPSDATVLFDGTDLSKWEKLQGGEAHWKVENGYMEVDLENRDWIITKDKFGDCHLHVEYAAPTEIVGESQGRGNSGIFMNGIYEVQVLDSCDNPTYADGSCCALYGIWPPLVNAMRKPGEWNTYDIFWFPPRFGGDELAQPAYITVIFNGIPMHIHKALPSVPAHKRVKPYEPHPLEGPIGLQDHRDPVRFRNIWVRPLKGYDAKA